MIIIGEKINGTRKRVKEAILDRDADFIKDLALRQVEAEVGYLDINAGTKPENEPEDMMWLIETVQTVTDVKLCLDSANPAALSAGFKVTNKIPMVNSLSGERNRIKVVLPLACENKTELIVIALDDNGIPATVEKRIEIIRRLVSMTREGGLPDNHLYIDPVITTLSTGIESGNRTFRTIRAILDEFPEAHITGGLSNISFGLPARSIINQAFVTLAIEAGMDTCSQGSG